MRSKSGRRISGGVMVIVMPAMRFLQSHGLLTVNARQVEDVSKQNLGKGGAQSETLFHNGEFLSHANPMQISVPTFISPQMSGIRSSLTSTPHQQSSTSFFFGPSEVTFYEIF